jgi:hypothetical protein
MNGWKDQLMGWMGCGWIDGCMDALMDGGKMTSSFLLPCLSPFLTRLDFVADKWGCRRLK